MVRLPDVGSVYRLIVAEGDALDKFHSERFVLRAPTSEIHKNGLVFDITDGVTAGRLNLTMTGASTITLDVYDPDWQVEASGILDLDGDRRMGRIDLELNGVWFRLAQANRQDTEALRLVFEDLTIAVLREHRKPMKAARGSMTRAQFLEKMVNELPAPLRLFYSPERDEKQPERQPDFPDATTPKTETGFDAGAAFKIKSLPANAKQKREVATVMTVCDQLNVTELVRQAITCAGIGESGFDASLTDFKTHTHKGVFQSDQIAQYDTEAQARAFLTGGPSFGHGGAIKLAKAHPDYTPGNIAGLVEVSGRNYPGAAASIPIVGQLGGRGNDPFYDQWLPEAKKIIAQWRGSNASASGDTVYQLQAYQFSRGLPGRRENSWEAMTRLAEEVNWRVYVAGGVVVYVTDDYLLGLNARLTIPTPIADYLTARPNYDWDHGKLAGDVTLPVIATRWSQLPGEQILLEGREWGPVRGRWLVLEVDQNLFDDTDCQITLTKPLEPRKEPAAAVTTTSGDTAGGRGSGTGDVFYVGDSLGVGTLPYFKRILRGTRVDSNVKSGRTSAEGITALQAAFRARTYDNIVFDLGTNDGTVQQLEASLKRARKIAPEAHIYVMTVNEGNEANLLAEVGKNRLLRGWSDAHVHLVDWKGYADQQLLQFDASQGIHPGPDGYRKRAHLIAKRMGFE